MERARRTALVIGIALAAVAAWGVTIACGYAAWQLDATLNDAAELARLGTHPQATVVFDRDGHVAFTYYTEQRIDVPLDRISQHMTDAIVSVEDRRFYSHDGLDGIRIVQAALRNWRAGHIVEGGSTLTQQLARAEQLSPVRTFTRKIREAVLAVRLEQRYSKAQILDAYLNTVYFGDGYYGVEAASRGYFGVHAADLSPAQAAMLAALVRSPYAYSPTVNHARALARRNLVLRLMRTNNALDDIAYRAAVATPLTIVSGGASVQASAADDCGLYYEEEVRRELVERFGSERVLQGGLRVYSGYDPAVQCAADRAVTTRIAQIVKLHPAARALQGSLVAIEPSTGEVRALVGGRDFHASSFDRATQARRQPGSAFKPIIYAAALEHGFAPGSVLTGLDQPLMVNGEPWLPNGEHEDPEYTLRDALRISSNRAAAQLLQRVGLSTATSYARRLGIQSRLPEVPSLALGTGGVTLMELTSAYGVFANRGVALTPHLVVKVEDQDGRLLWSADPDPRPAVSPDTAFMMTSMLADVINAGTATGVRAAGFRLPAAGKTGTTDDYADAWFVGYTPHLVAGVWFGMDQPTSIMHRGFAAVVAVPAWAAFMKQATAHDKADWYTPPPDVQKVAICKLSGELPTDACRRGWLGAERAADGFTQLPGEAIDERTGRAVALANASAHHRSDVEEDYFPVDMIPTETCHLHTDGSSTAATDAIATASSTAPAYQTAALKVERVVRPDGTIAYVVHQ